MKKLVLILTIALFALGGCKTVKQTETAKSSNTTGVTVSQSGETNKDIKLTVDSSRLTIDKGQISEAISEEITRTEFSNPDSSGKQHVTVVTTTKRGITRNENKNLQVQQHNSTDIRDKSDYKSETNASIKNKEESKQQSMITVQKNYLWLYVVSCVVVLALILIYLLKKNWYTLAFKWVLNVIKKCL